MEARDTFDTVADLYGEIRKGYPAALFDDLTALGGLGPDARVLEVGCGAGQATGDLAARAGHVTALDPGPALIDQARARVPAANARFVVAGFEGFDAPPASFDLVVSAQAWHWIDPQIAFAKAADLLKPGGTLAVFGHVPFPPPEPFIGPFHEIYDRFMPGAWGTPPPQAGYLPDGPFAPGFDASGRFGPVTHRGYAWTWDMDGSTFGKYMRTDSSYRGLPEAVRFGLFDALQGAIEAVGQPCPMSWETHLYLARRA